MTEGRRVRSPKNLDTKYPTGISLFPIVTVVWKYTIGLIVGTPKIYIGILLYLHDQTYLGHVVLILQVTDQTNLQFSFYLSVPTTGICTVKPLIWAAWHQ